ncbi:MAG: rod shape-determining protein MreD [Actinobacteria bacterium RBG_19FT_COMBO_54_7]|uniref:Rod shape-determining protein MreD n=1 Tax=Candidatus Solincola sediminis TaxID=1797199 RepID=A0A1F2WQ05_9ACTN|nr:MAG: rod shape-determining protein MreD [Candidatus Solincola sediminis]OFW58925.1 MAG: rod shape-determining protein MreD [Candidatus Solincola sediminis]OFW70508.1 MAG: rod shape-determining protein MreD [Actinobacteria bacterium RBG_19FT_COMBO_54_7]
MHRRLFFFVTLVIALLAQLTIAPEIRIGVIKPDILLVLTVCWALVEGPGQGAIFGFSAGLLEDIFTTATVGVSAFSKTLIGYFTGEVRQRIVSKSVIWPMLIVFIATIVQELLKFMTWTMVGVEEMPPFNFGVIVGLALFDAAITLLIYPIIGRLAARDERALMFQ